MPSRATAISASSMPSTPTVVTSSSTRRARTTARTSGRVRTGAARTTAVSGGRAGAPEMQVRGGALLLLAIAAASACSAGADPPRRLADGAPPPEAKVTLDDPLPQVWTRVISVDAVHAELSSQAQACIESAREHSPTGTVVIRVGVVGSSTTLRTSASRGVVACDETAGRRERNTHSCGRAYGRLVGAKLADPRLDLAGCVTPAGDPVAFAWFEPHPRTVLAAVRQDGYLEVDPAAAGLAIRISTTAGIDVEAPSATFDVSQYDARGAFIRSSALHARVAG